MEKVYLCSTFVLLLISGTKYDIFPRYRAFLYHFVILSAFFFAFSVI